MNTTYHDFIYDRRGQTNRWCPSDSESNYAPVQSDGRANYKPEDFDYKFNSEGFRCDEFTSHSDFPILFMGCSVTEGIGLPLDHCWPHFLLEKIRAMHEHRNQVIPFHSIAVGGTGVDAAARYLVKHIDQIKPKVIFYFCINIYRRELCYSNINLRSWLPNYVNRDDTDPIATSLSNRIFSEPSYAMFQTYRSLEIINLAARLHNATVFLMANRGANPELFSQGVLDSFSNIIFVDTMHNIQSNDPRVINSLLMARDGIHYGPRRQMTLAEQAMEAYTKWSNHIQLG